MRTLFGETEEINQNDLFSDFIKKFNEIRREFLPRSRGIKPTTSNLKNRFRQIIKAGISLEDIDRIIRGAFEDDWHKNSGWKWITPEFVLRDKIVQRYIDFKPEKIEKLTDTDF